MNCLQTYLKTSARTATQRCACTVLRRSIPAEYSSLRRALRTRATSEAVRVETIETAIRYIRIYRFEDALENIKEHLRDASVILDLRYTRSESLGYALSDCLDSAQSATTCQGRHAAQGSREWPAADTNTTAVHDTTHRRTLQPANRSHLRQSYTPRQMAPYAVGETTAYRTGFYKEIEVPAWLLRAKFASRPIHLSRNRLRAAHSN